jgi:hypothetical protein
VRECHQKRFRRIVKTRIFVFVIKRTLLTAAVGAGVIASVASATGVPHVWAPVPRQVPQGSNPSLISFSISHAQPQPGHSFVLATMTTAPEAIDRIRIFGIRCLAALNGRPVRTHVEALRLRTNTVVGAVCRVDVPRRSTGSVLSFAGLARDGFSVSIGNRTARKPTRTISHFAGVWTVRTPPIRRVRTRAKRDLIPIAAR